MRARGLAAAAEFVASAESVGVEGGLSYEDVWMLAEHVEVSDHERGLGEDAERVGVLGQHLEYTAGEPILALGTLVRIGVRPHGHRVA